MSNESKEKKETFDADWLALREAADHRSRATALLGPLVDWWRARKGGRVLDLGSGTGSNLRYLAPVLPGPQAWTLVDHDEDLLARVRPPEGGVEVTLLRADLAGGDLARLPGSDLVTGSALLDLVSPSWLASLASACADQGAAALFALTYDGIIEWSVPGGPTDDPTDALVRAAVNEHQRGNKGFGPALGPTAGPAAEAAFQAMGYRTWLAPSPWVLGPDDASLVEALVEGWAGAAAELHPAERARLQEWAARRAADVAAGRLRVTVGHLDVLALPPGRTGGDAP